MIAYPSDTGVVTWGSFIMQDRNGEKSVPSGSQGHAPGGAAQPKGQGGGSPSASGLRVQLRQMSYDQQVQRLEPHGEPAPGGAGGLDEASVERWIQSALNLVLAAGLSVDGVLAGPTKAAVSAFQRKAPELIGKRLAVDGIAGANTVAALEQATKSDAPKAHEADSKKTEAPAEQGPGGAAGLALAGAKGALDNVADGVVEGQVKGEIQKLAAQGKKGQDPAVVDMSQAYDEAKAWTIARKNALDTDRAVSVKATLEEKWQDEQTKFEQYQAMEPKKGRAPKDPGSKADYIDKNWFRQYWLRWCYQFAAKVSEFLDGNKAVGLKTLVARTKDAAAKGEANEVKGRTALHRGKTMAEAGADEAATPKLAPGTSFHVKLHFEGDNPYEFDDDFHHWMLYAGNGKFSDTLTGKDKSGAAMDQSLKNWVKSAFAHPDYAFMHADPRFTVEKKGNKPLPLPNLQPRISAEYDPRQSTNKKEG